MDEEGLQRQVRRAKLWNTLIFSFFAVIAIAVLIGLAVLKYRHTFTIEKWLKEPDDRINIVNNLLEKHNLVGMTKEEIIFLLGEEEDYANTKTSFKISNSYFEPESNIVYYLGIEYMDDIWLIISLENNIVVSYCIDVT